MNGMKSLFLGALIVLLGTGGLSAVAAAPKQAAPPATPVASEKSVLAEPAKQQARSESTDDVCQCLGQGDKSATKRIERALDAPLHNTGLDYADQPLADVVTQLGEEYGIPIHLNKAALEEAGIATDTQINLTIHNISLRSALRLMLKAHQLVYVIEDEVLTITTPQDAEKDLKVCIYDVRKIAGDKADLTPLIDTISSCVAKETWAKNGKGSAEIRSPKPGLLVISQTQMVHNDIRNLLTALDETHHDHQGDAGGPAPKSAPGGSAEHGAPAGAVPPRKGAASGESAPRPVAADNPFGG